MRIHAVGLPHSAVDRFRNPDCAFTQRLLRWTQMMTARDHEVFLYHGVGGPVPEATRSFECLTEDEFARWFDYGKTHGLDTSVRGVPTFNRRVIKAMREQIQPEDFILLTWGRPQLPVAMAFPNNISIEGAIGYGDRVLNYAVFDTYTWMHYMYGKQGLDQGRFFDTAILGPFDPDQFLPAAPIGHFDGTPYLLHIARLTPLKGVQIAQELAEAVEMNLVVCGGGDESLLWSDRVRYMGVVDHKERARLLQGATALIAPTQYIEPGGQVVVEAAMAGVPAITTDFGCFLETNQRGWRAHIMSEFIVAAKMASTWDAEDRRQLQLWARDEYGYDWVGQQWENYLIRLHRLYGPGFYG
jgi:glycosyltransferase involved in cell wall biosynthesis